MLNELPQTWVLRYQDKLTGFLRLLPQSQVPSILSNSNSTLLWIDSLVIETSQRGNGLGSEFIEGLLQNLSECLENSEVSILICAQSSCHSLFLKLGFEQVSNLNPIELQQLNFIKHANTLPGDTYFKKLN